MASQFKNLLFLDHVLHFNDIIIMHHTGNRLDYLLAYITTDCLTKIIMQIAQLSYFLGI
jgi:hypothetical protein